MALTRKEAAKQLRAIKPKMIQLKIYTSEEFVAEFGEFMTEELKAVTLEKIELIQAYFDDFCVQPRKEYEGKE